MDKLSLLSDHTKLNQELANLFGCSIVTISRWRKKYGISVPRGGKKGKSRPWQIKRKTLCCPECNTEFEVIPSKKQIYCSQSCAAKTCDKSYMQTEEYKNCLRKETTPEYVRYRNRVTKLSEQTYQRYKDVLNPHGYIRTICGVENGYQLDHILSVKECFLRGLTPEETSRLENLQILPWRTNLIKR
jgi:transposase